MAKMKMGETKCKNGLRLKRTAKGVRIIGSCGGKKKTTRKRRRRKAG